LRTPRECELALLLSKAEPFDELFGRQKFFPPSVCRQRANFKSNTKSRHANVQWNSKPLSDVERCGALKLFGAIRVAES
jgi:hypothetical protein